ncbi:ABC transporter substrate-binding protein [Candidatus Nitrosocosmicus hydrocola]|uniref:ABC transporter substrate-binding protein n=1 Tax=Candidatus Nitrosocosmicus hydrocola TaxID=1826872 RepID=UPI0011E607D2|nr:penicillin-binding protein activator [Candidatus Nitrosocosmicus hydrocola]
MHPIYFFIALVFAISIANLLIIFADSDAKIIYSSWMLIINSAIASSLSIFALLKERHSIKKDKTAIYLTMGLIFYFLANIVWGYYELVLDVVSPVPSLADLFLLSAYGFLIYRLLVTYKNLEKVSNKNIIYLITIGTGLFLAYILNLTLSLTEISNFRGLMLFVVTIAYPILNSVLTVLALTILLNLKNEKEMSIPWICELIGLLAIVIGDSWFAIIVLTAFVDQIWISAVLISAHYLLIAGGLIWYIRYSTSWSLERFNFKNKFMSKKSFNKKIIAVIVTVALSFTITLLIATNNIELLGNGMVFLQANPDSKVIDVAFDNEDIKLIGAIVPQTGSLSSIGKPIVAALKKAEKEVNEHYENINSTSRVKLLLDDSKTSPEETVAAIKRLDASGAKVIVGPATSTAVASVKDYANQNNITLLSYASTSPILSIEGDNLFRLVPDDITQGKVMAEKMIDDGVTVIVPFWRGDIYGNALANATKYYFEKLGGKVEEGVNYLPHTGKFATSLHRINFIMWNQELKKLNDMVTEAISKNGPDSVGVYVISFDEITPILIQAQLFEELGKVRWYGSDSIAENHHVTKNIDSAVFASQTHFANPLFSISSESKKSSEFEKDLLESYHGSSITYPALAYDSFWIAALSLHEYADAINEGRYNENVTIFNQILTRVSESYEGVTGKIDLNAAGDRTSDNYDFWYVTKDNSTQHYEWHKENNKNASVPSGLH